ncbi:MAG: PorV/PorQ family protein [candidate division FCPU426 bacterium]
MLTKTFLSGLFAMSLGLALVLTAAASGTSGGLVLTQGAGARTQALAETGAGASGTVDSLYWNPAGMASVDGLQAQATYLMGMEESAYQQLLAGYPVAGLGTFGLGLSLLQGGAVDLDQADGSFVSVQSQSDWAVSIGYGVQVSSGVRAGAAVKMLNSTLVEKYTASAFAGDVGLQVAAAAGLVLGAVVQNIGTEITYESEGDPLPLTLRAGAAYSTRLAAGHELILLADGLKPNDRDFALHVGAEYAYAGLLAARLGYKAGYDIEGLTAGLGVRWSVLELDYAFGLVQELTSTHRISLLVRL